MSNETNNGGTPARTMDPKSCITPKFRVSFPAVFEPKLPPGKTADTDKKYSITMLYQVEGPEAVDLSPLKNAVKAAIAEKFGADETKWPRGKDGKLTFKLPFRDRKEKDYEGYGEGIVFCTAPSKHDRKPGLIFGNKEPIINPNDFYGGCYARAKVNAYWFDAGVNKGVAIGLQNIQKWADGEPFSGKTKPENDFDAIPEPGAPKTAEAAAKDPLF